MHGNIDWKLNHYRSPKTREQAKNKYYNHWGRWNPSQD